MVIHQLQVRCWPGKVRRSETDVLLLSYTTNCTYSQQRGNKAVAVLHNLGQVVHTRASVHQAVNWYRCKLGTKQAPYTTH